MVIPVHNAEKWLDEALESIQNQTWKESLELSIYNDACNVSNMSFFSNIKDMQQS